MSTDTATAATGPYAGFCLGNLSPARPLEACRREFDGTYRILSTLDRSGWRAMTRAIAWLLC